MLTSTAVLSPTPCPQTSTLRAPPCPPGALHTRFAYVEAISSTAAGQNAWPSDADVPQQFTAAGRNRRRLLATSQTATIALLLTRSSTAGMLSAVLRAIQPLQQPSDRRQVLFGPQSHESGRIHHWAYCGTPSHGQGTIT